MKTTKNTKPLKFNYDPNKHDFKNIKLKKSKCLKFDIDPKLPENWGKFPGVEVKNSYLDGLEEDTRQIENLAKKGYIVIKEPKDYKKYCKTNKREEEKIIKRIERCLKHFYSRIDGGVMGFSCRDIAKHLYNIAALGLTLELAQKRIYQPKEYKAEMESFV